MREVNNPKEIITGYFGMNLDEVEKVNPIEYYTSAVLAACKTFTKMELDAGLFAFVSRDVFKMIFNTKIPECYFKLYKAQNKNEERRILHEQNITVPLLMNYIFVSCADHGYTYSNYSCEMHHLGLDMTQLPKWACYENGQIEKVGITSLSDAQIKHAITQRKRILAKFIDKGARWHCFITTYSSLGGKERGHPQAHYHYLSDKFGMSRQEIVEKIKSGHYPSSPIHLNLLDYGYQSSDGSNSFS